MVETHHVECTAGDPVPDGAMSAFFGPGHVDQTIRMAIQACWMVLPAEKRTAQEVEKQVRRIVDRALADFAEDVDAFGKSGPLLVNPPAPGPDAPS